MTGTGAKSDPYKPCVLEEHDCVSTTTEAPWGAFVAFSDCDYTAPIGCPVDLVITQEEIIQGGPLITDSSPEKFEVYSKMISVPKGGVCKMQISVEDRPASDSVPGVDYVAAKAAIEVDNTAVPPITVRVPEVLEVTAVAAIPSYTASKKNGGFGATEWMDNIDVMLTLLEADDRYDSDTSSMSS